MNVKYIDYKVILFEDYHIQIEIIDTDSFDQYKISNYNVEWTQFNTGYEIKSKQNNYKKILKFLGVKPKFIKEMEKDLLRFTETSIYVIN